MIVLFGGLIGLLEIICTPALMWLFYMLFLIGLTQPSLTLQDLASRFFRDWSTGSLHGGS